MIYHADTTSQVARSSRGHHLIQKNSKPFLRIFNFKESLLNVNFSRLRWLLKNIITLNYVILQETVSVGLVVSSTGRLVVGFKKKFFLLYSTIDMLQFYARLKFLKNNSRITAEFV